MAVTFLSGFAPNFIKNRKALNLLAVLGGGILLGTALFVILTESVRMLVVQNY